MCGEQGIIAVHETTHLVDFLAKVANFFFSNAYVTLLSTTGKNKLLRDWSKSIGGGGPEHWEIWLIKNT